MTKCCLQPHSWRPKSARWRRHCNGAEDDTVASSAVSVSMTDCLCCKDCISSREACRQSDLAASGFDCRVGAVDDVHAAPASKFCYTSLNILPP